MAVRNPLYVDGTDLKEMSSSQITEIVNRCVYAYASDPSVTLTVVDNNGNLDAITDTRLQAGTSSTSVSAFVAETSTSEPDTVTITYDKINQSIATVSTPNDTDSKAYPVFYNSGSIQAMTATDMFDTFVDPAIDLLVDGNSRSGTFTIHTATTLTDHTLISSTPIFTNTIANVSAYTQAGLPETRDQPTTVLNYYLFQKDQGSAISYTAPLKIVNDENLQTYTDASFDNLIRKELRHHTVNTSGSQITYNINGSGATKGTMIDTKLNGSGNYQTRLINVNDYRSQEFPNGTAVTAATYLLKILRS